MDTVVNSAETSTASKKDANTSNDRGAEKKSETELERLGSLARNDPDNFNYWVGYLRVAEKEPTYELGKTAFEEFLKLFPLCYGYWQKYASYTSKSDIQDAKGRIRDIYERAVAAVAPSVDMWTNYLTYLEQSFYDGSEEDAEGNHAKDIRSVYERAVAACGTDPNASGIWNGYLTFEQKQPDGETRVCAIYRRIVTQTWQGGAVYWQLYLQILQQCSLSSITTDDELKTLREQMSATESSSSDATKEGEDAVDEATLRAKIIELRTSEYSVAANEAYKRASYEMGIKRPYYHVKALDDAEIENWIAYLVFEETQSSDGSHHEVVRNLYERCLVPCANIPKIWIRYVRWMEANDAYSVSDVESVFERACSLFVRNLPEVHMERALWYESRGNRDEAEKIYIKLTSSIAPGLLESIVRFANFKRRQGNWEGADTVYVDAIEATTDPATKAFLCVQRASFLRASAGDTSRVALAAYEAALSAVPTDKHLWSAYIHFVIDTSMRNNATDNRKKATTKASRKRKKDGETKEDDATAFPSVSAAFEKAVDSSLSFDDKSEMWQWRLSLEEDSGSDVNNLRKLQKDFATWLANGGTAQSEAKKARVDATPTVDNTQYWQTQSQYGAYAGHYAASHDGGSSGASAYAAASTMGPYASYSGVASYGYYPAQ
eukprot:g74.t1